MALFRYVAVSPTGQKDRGLIEADSPRQVRSQLRRLELTALSVVAAADSPLGRPRFGRAAPHLSSGELALITRQYAALLGANLTAEHALNALIEQAVRPFLRDILVGLRAEVRAGTSLADAMAKQPGAFPDLYRALVRGGEDAGALPRVMAELADHLEAREAVRQKLALALLYPATIAIVATLVVGGLMIYVLPQLASVFSQNRQQLPWLTTALLGLSDFLSRGGPWLLLAGVVAGFGLRRLYGLPSYRRRAQQALVSLPVVGHLLKLEAGARFGSTLAILLSGGVPLLRALIAAADGASLEIFGEAVRRAAERVREGAPLSRSLRAEEQFPPLLLHFVASGEAGGELPAMLRHAARQLQGELDIRLRWLGGLLEPALIVAMGVVVLTIVLAILMPIIETNHLLR